MDYLKDGIGLRAMAQRDPLVEYQREGFSLYQSMMGAIREESIGFLFNLDVEVTGADGTSVEARGLTASEQRGLSYSAPSDDASGEVEVRDQRGRVERAATERAQRQAAEFNDATAPQQPEQGDAPQQRPTGNAGGGRGAFGQRVDGAGQAAPANRAERRAQQKRR